MFSGIWCKKSNISNNRRFIKKLLELSKVIESDSNSFKDINIYVYFLKRLKKLKNSLNTNIEFLELLEHINKVIKTVK